MMSKKRFSLLLAVLSLFVLVFSSFAVACGDKDNDGDGEVTFTFDVAETVDLPYYEYYEIPEIVATDSSGNLYFTTVKVTNDNGKTIDVEQGKFFVLYTDNYYIEYTTVYNEEKISKTTTGIVKDKTAPEVVLAANELGCFVGEKVTVPEFTFGDNFDKEEDLTVSIKVYLDDEEISLTSGEFTPAESGVYDIKYTVTDKAGNATTETAKVAVADREEGNIAYFNNDMTTALAGVKANLSSTLSGRGTGDKASPMGGSSTGLSFSNAASPYGGRIDVTRPAITDVSNYQYIYYWVYTPYAGGVTLSYNNVFRGALTSIKSNVWTRIAFEKGADGNFYLPATDSREEGATTMLFGQAADATDIANMLTEYTSLIVGITPTALTSDVIDVFFGGFYAVNELPNLPQGTVAWTPAPKLTVSGVKSMALTNSTITPVLSVSNTTEPATIKKYVSYDGGERTEITTENYTFTNLGTYVFYFEASIGETIVDTVEKSVIVLEPEEGNIAYFNNERWQDIVEGECVLATNLGLRGTDAAASPLGGTSTVAYTWTGQSEVGRLDICSPAITDISSYQYLYLLVYTDFDGGIYMTYNNVWKGTKNKIEKGVWTRITFEKGADGNYYTMATDDAREGATTKLFDSVTSGIRPSDISGFMLAFAPVSYQGNVVVSAYFGGFYATNDMPALPQGVVEWMPAPVVKVSNLPAISYVGDTVMPLPSVDHSSAGTTIKKYVSINGGAKTEFTTLTYTYLEVGTYVFTFEAVKDTAVIASVTKTATVKSASERTTFTIVDFTDPDVESLFSTDGGWSSAESGKSQNNQGTVTHPNGTSSFYQILCETYGGVLINAPAITDLSSYNYAFIDVYFSDNGGSFTFNNIWGYNPSLNVEKGVWTRIVIVNDGTGKFTMPSASANGTLPVFENSASVSAYSMFVQANSWCYLGEFAACNELPELPAGMATNYTPTV